MSPPDSSKFSGEKPRSDIYTMMLLIALIALTTGCVMLWLEGSNYGAFLSWWKVPRF